MEVSIERLIEIIVGEVVAELSRRGISVDLSAGRREATNRPVVRKQLCEIMDLKSYRSPVLTENHLASLDPGVREIVLPKGTVVTPGARDIVSRRNLKLISSLKTN